MQLPTPGAQPSGRGHAWGENHVQGCAKEMVPGCEKSSACLQPAQAVHARLVLTKTVTFYAQLCTALGIKKLMFC